MENFNTNLKSKVIEAFDFLKSKTDFTPEIAIILGTGLGKLANDIKPEFVISYDDIPYFPTSTVESHHGRLIFGYLEGKKIVAMQGRFHYYEGYSLQQITFPVRVFKQFGINQLIVTNACGSVNPHLPKANVMVIDDHINLIGDNPLIGPHDDYFGPRFVDLSEPYCKKCIEQVERIALNHRIKLYRGVYAAMSGSSLETRAEYRYLRTIGADVIGMSTIPETIVARQMGMKVLGFSVITDECYPDALKPISLKEMIETADIAEPSLTKIIKEFVKDYIPEKKES